jgi:RNA polymerase primary sigma factor
MIKNKKENPKKKVAKKNSVKTKKKAVSIIVPEKLDELIKKGKTRGFVTFGEILTFFPNIEDNIQEIDEMLQRLEQLGIEIKESKGYLDTGKTTKKKKSSSVKINSVQSYLKEIGKIPAITAKD